MDTDLTS